jgi:hypothetical protein
VKGGRVSGENSGNREAAIKSIKAVNPTNAS